LYGWETSWRIPMQREKEKREGKKVQ
jgi:hypothetical protein